MQIAYAPFGRGQDRAVLRAVFGVTGVHHVAALFASHAEQQGVFLGQRQSYGTPARPGFDIGVQGVDDFTLYLVIVFRLDDTSGIAPLEVDIDEAGALGERLGFFNDRFGQSLAGRCGLFRREVFQRRLHGFAGLGVFVHHHESRVDQGFGGIEGGAVRLGAVIGHQNDQSVVAHFLQQLAEHGVGGAVQAAVEFPGVLVGFL